MVTHAAAQLSKEVQPQPFYDQVSQWRDRVSRAGNPTTNAIRYIEKWMPLALEIERVYHVPAAFLIAQSAVESGWGTSPICRLAHNFFGVKWYIGTPYWDGGIAYQQYTTAAASWREQGRILTNKTYKTALRYKDNVQRYAREVQRLGYCPNIRYSRMITDIVEDFLLEE